MTMLTRSGAVPSEWFWYLTENVNVVAVVPVVGVMAGSDRRVGPDDAIAGNTARTASRIAARAAPDAVCPNRCVPHRIAMNTGLASSPGTWDPVRGEDRQRGTPDQWYWRHPAPPAWVRPTYRWPRVSRARGCGPAWSVVHGGPVGRR